MKDRSDSGQELQDWGIDRSDTDAFSMGCCRDKIDDQEMARSCGVWHEKLVRLPFFLFDGFFNYVSV